MNFKDNSNYQALLKALGERPGDFITVVGAGLSTHSGLPIWSKLATLLINDAEAFEKEQAESGNPLDIKTNYESLRNNKKLWKVMELVKAVLQTSQFENAIKNHLRFKNTPPPPKALVNLWKIGIKGIITPNLDSLAQDAYAYCFSKNVDVSTAVNNTNYLEFLGDERHFVFQPHGQLSDTNSWVLTPDSLAKLLRDPSYKSWWDSVLSNRNLVFVGVNESDISLQSYLINNFSKRTHYVIAPLSSVERLWLLQETGFLHVPYEVMNEGKEDEDHTQLCEIIESFVGLNPKEIIPPPAYDGKTKSISSLPTPSELQKLPVNSKREILNAAVASIFPEGDAEERLLIEYDNIRKKYLDSLFSASAIEPNTDFNLVHDYRVMSLIGQGSFGRVFLAENISTKEVVALKVIHHQMISSGAHLNAFRRGALAMKILTNKKMDGMANFIKAYEVPFSIVMEYIQGQNLEEAISKRSISSLLTKLKIVRRIAEVIYASHSIEEQVLHRDLKPANVLLSGYDYDMFSPNEYVKLVDFDLCWHKYASAESIVHQKGSHGYAPPEMFDNSIGSTRKAYVDVYGLGMILYYVLTNNHPLPGMTDRKTFETDLSEFIRNNYPLKWSAQGWHLARAVVISTYYRPQDRCSVQDFVALLDTAIALELDANCARYIRIIGLQMVELVVGANATSEVHDFGRIHICRHGPKSLKCELKNEREGINITSRVLYTKDQSLGGSQHEKRDHKVEEKLKRVIDTKKYRFIWTSDRGQRVATISAYLSCVNLKSISDFAASVKKAWIEIEQYT